MCYQFLWPSWLLTCCLLKYLSLIDEGMFFSLCSQGIFFVFSFQKFDYDVLAWISLVYPFGIYSASGICRFVSFYQVWEMFSYYFFTCLTSMTQTFYFNYRGFLGSVHSLFSPFSLSGSDWKISVVLYFLFIDNFLCSVIDLSH